MNKVTFISSILSIILSACSTFPSSSETSNTLDSAAPKLSSQTATETRIPFTSTPSITPEPSNTPTITLTPTPTNQYFRDDFNEDLTEEWMIDYESVIRHKITDNGTLRLVAENDSLLGQGKQSNLFWHSLPDGNYDISVHVITNPNENFQQAAIFLYENRNNYVTINRGYCAPCGGSGFFMDHKIAGAWGTYKAFSKESDVYLRLENKDGVISGYYATEPDKWIRLGQVGNFYNFKKAGLGVSNCAPTKSNLIAEFDWFLITK